MKEIKVQRIQTSSNIQDLTDIVEERVQLLLKEGANTPMDFKWMQPELPEFFDEKKFDLGQRTYHHNLFSMMVAKLSGLVTVLAVPTILDVLIFTQQSSTVCTAFRRYVSTVLHTWIWYKRKPGVEYEFLDSLKIVRKKHCMAFRRSAQAGCKRVSQLDMAVAQFGFIGFTLLSGDFLGVNATSEELDALVHLWHVVGNMLGMEEKYNICNGTLEETKILCGRLLEEVILPLLANKSKDFDVMSRQLIEGLWAVNPQLDTDAFVGFTLHLASQAAPNNNHSIKIDTAKMSSYSRFLFDFQLFVHQRLLRQDNWWSNIFRIYFNAQMRLSLFLTEYFPFLAYYMFGRKKSHVNIFALRH